ncbi:uncharacterized protein EDB91DRAFT_1256544 [Suillus paluster]|uniref:uncharacterized protein n=1 Tax=Suillus paluster TaxID=48578 RepID=UPI001B864DCB|nr:uncharacterized protein EDB91DRAFT_1256544 [Suillus paluster]KAG1721364.1 hypothetical protein EDB91DRAFT_1256544 [Suillus paluster]
MSLFASSLFVKSKQHFQHQMRLSTYGGSIHVLAISNDGQALACGGTKGIKLWDIKSRKELTCLIHHHESQGTVSCAVWVTTRLGMAETLCYGTGLGYVVFLRHSHVDEICARRLGSGFEITCMVWDSTSSETTTWIAVGTRDKIVQVLILNTNSQLQAMFSVRLDNTVPKYVAFADNGCVYVFRLYDGNFIKLKGDDGAVVKEYSCQSVIGHAAVNQKRGVFVVDNATDGFTLYQLEGDKEPVRTFMTAAPSVSIPKQVAFAAQGKLIIGGSDHGLVYVFERKSGKLLETLCHSNMGLVQTIATHDLNRRCTVTSSSPALGHGKATINLWVYNYGPAKETLTSEDSQPMSHVIMRAFKILVHFGALVVIICFLITNYFDAVATWSGDLAQRMGMTRVLDFSDNNFHQSAKVFNEVPEAHQEVDEQSNILMLHELAGKLIEVI